MDLSNSGIGPNLGPIDWGIVIDYLTRVFVHASPSLPVRQRLSRSAASSNIRPLVKSLTARGEQDDV